MANETEQVLSKEEKALVKDLFSYHAPTPAQTVIYRDINAAFQNLANTVLPLLPAGKMRDAALQSLIESRMRCNAAVALEGRF